MLAVLALLAGCSPAAVEADRHQPDAVRQHYFNGDQRIEVEVALDHLGLALTADETQAWQSGVEFSAVPDLAALEARARQAGRDAGTAALAVLRGPGGAEHGLLTHRLSLRVKPGTDAAALAAAHGARVLEAVGYSPDTYILGAPADDLLAALRIANALHDDPAVVSSTPLILVRRAHRDPDRGAGPAPGARAR